MGEGGGEMTIEKYVFYKIDGDIAISIRKVLSRIKTIDFRGNYGLSESEIQDIQSFLDNVSVDDEEDV